MIPAPPGFRGCFGHRGAAGIFPENTLEGFALAARIGVDVVETDAHITRDGRVVLIHDPTVDRTTDGVGEVAAMTFAELQALDAGARFVDRHGSTPFAGRGLRVPALDEVLAALPNTRFNIELKSDVDGAPEILAATLDRGRAQGRILLASEGGDRMIALRRAVPWAPTSFSAPEVFGFISGLHEDAYEPPPACALQVPDVFDSFEVVTERFVARARELDIAVHVWTINDPAQSARLLEMGCDGLITDHPERWAAVQRRSRP
jgi:glycerophosphoryl diester phosphodiesterase